MIFLSVFLSSLLIGNLQNSGSELTLQVKAEGITTSSGYLMAELRNEAGKVVQQVRHDLKNGSAFTFTVPAPGRYAVAMFHDKNADGELNTAVFGIPTEAYGFSNNARGRFGPPALKDQLFEVSANKSISISLK